MRTAFIAVIAAYLVGASTTPSLAQEADFSGNWELNQQMSQDHFEKIYIALGSEQLQGAGTRAYNSVSSSTLLRDTDRADTLRALLDFAKVLGIIEIEQNEKEIKIWVGQGDEFFSLFYLDGKKHARELPAGLRLEASAEWREGSIHVEQIGENKAVLQQVYSLLGEGDQMAFLFKLDSNLSEVPVQFRLVYDRVDGD